MRQALQQVARRVAPKAWTGMGSRTHDVGTKASVAPATAMVVAVVAAGTKRRSARLIAAADVSAGYSRALNTLSPVETDPVQRKHQKTAAKKTKAPVNEDVESSAAADKLTKDESKASVLFKHGTLSRSYEIAKIAKGYKMVVGVDEAGRGPLAGPVVAAACYVPVDVVIEGVHDSKKLNEEQREVLYDLLVNHPRVKYAVHVNSAQRIDEINILQASLESMVKAAEALDETPDFVFVDGNRMPPTIKCDAETVVKGDSKVYSIAAASIIAKVVRDRIMVEYDAKYPQYNLKQHKGYPTRDHMAAIAKHGACEIHRMTFAPLKPKEVKKKKAATTTKKVKATKPKTQ